MIPIIDTRRLFCLICLCLLSGLITGQASSQRAADSGVEAIKAAYSQFRYAEVISLSLQSLAATPPPSKAEKVEIYTYLAFARVSLGQNEAARKDFEAALGFDPKLTLDPVYVSPKIIDLFNEVRLQLQAQQPAEDTGLDREPGSYDMRAGAAWRSLVLPGWGQWYKKQMG
jgi:tetratricopeptide (TPR) repeat protein